MSQAPLLAGATPIWLNIQGTCEDVVPRSNTLKSLFMHIICVDAPTQSLGSLKYVELGSSFTVDPNMWMLICILESTCQALWLSHSLSWLLIGNLVPPSGMSEVTWNPHPICLILEGTWQVWLL